MSKLNGKDCAVLSLLGVAALAVLVDPKNALLALKVAATVVTGSYVADQYLTKDTIDLDLDDIKNLV